MRFKCKCGLIDTRRRSKDLSVIEFGSGDPVNKENLITTIKTGKKKTGVFLLAVVGLISIALVSAVWARTNTNGRYLAESLQDEPIMLQVPPLAQSQATSCGEAVIVMAHNYAHAETPLNEADVIAYAADKGYFTEEAEPFTSPANMVKITRHYTNDHSSGIVFGSDQGLSLLIRKLRNGEPVIIDVLTHLDDPDSSAHFVLVTGLAVDPNDSSAVTVHFNNPLTGANESAAWDGDTGIWHAWQNNPDPGGSGWWLVISPQ